MQPSWIDVDEARDKILSFLDVLEAEEKPLLDCLGQVLARDVRSEIDIPPLDNAAMDGYAVRSADLAGASEETPRRLRVIEEVPAGSVPQRRIEPGDAARIMTGAPVPAGADTVVQFELTDEVDRRSAGDGALVEVGVRSAIGPGLNIRRAGEDVARGALILRRGTVIRPAEAGVLASLGLAVAPVIRRPVVAILSTGDELLEPGEPAQLGKIYNSNTTSVAGLILRYGGIPKLLGIARDQAGDLSAKIRAGLQADLLVTSAGVSLGDYDIVKNVLAQEGEIAFWTVRIKPGKPLAFGVLTERRPDGSTRRIPHLGLPGNPVASMVAFEQFGRPALLKMLGKTVFEKPVVTAVLEDTIPNRDGRRYFVRGRVRWEAGAYHVRTTGPQGSGILTSMAQANCLIVVPDGVTEVCPGTPIRVQMLDWGDEYWVDGTVPTRAGAPAIGPDATEDR
ncbi:MAG TPA: gephyrin-like molybdotransferase Glp [Dehalococcoidia bacterium]|nr:gephyrin-like molybdotransferase Glp [Dehalococcoidia bacterium]